MSDVDFEKLSVHSTQTWTVCLPNSKWFNTDTPRGRKEVEWKKRKKVCWIWSLW